MNQELSKILHRKNLGKYQDYNRIRIHKFLVRSGTGEGNVLVIDVMAEFNSEVLSIILPLNCNIF